MWFWLKKKIFALFGKNVYLDYASTTPMDSRVLLSMNNVYKRVYGNSGGLYHLGVEVKKIISESRKKVSQLLNASQGEIVFTRGGTESDNMAILGVVKKFKKDFPNRTPHIITSTIEHDAVLKTCQYLESSNQATVTYVSCDTDGIISINDIKKALTLDTVLITIMYANNEIGTIQPIKEISKLVRWYKKQNKIVDSIYPLVHTDAVQAINYLDCNLSKLGVDLLTLSGSKIYGPKSSGILYIKNKEYVEPLFFGGNQELGFRAGTEDVANIIGFTNALEITLKQKNSEYNRIKEMQNWLLNEFKKNKKIIINGSITERLPNNVNISIQGITGEWSVIALAAKGFSVSAKSACTSGNDDASHVIQAIRDAQGIKLDSQEGSLRISLGRFTKKNDLERFLKTFNKIITEKSSH